MPPCKHSIITLLPVNGWLNLSGVRITDIKAIRSRFGLSLCDAVAVLDEYRQQKN